MLPQEFFNSKIASEAFWDRSKPYSSYVARRVLYPILAVLNRNYSVTCFVSCLSYCNIDYSVFLLQDPELLLTQHF